MAPAQAAVDFCSVRCPAEGGSEGLLVQRRLEFADQVIFKSTFGLTKRLEMGMICSFFRDWEQILEDELDDPRSKLFFL